VNWRLSRRKGFIAAGAAVLLAAGGITAGLVATSGDPAVPALYMAGIAENPCAPGQAVPVTVLAPGAAAESFLPDSSVLSSDRQSSCTAAAVAASKQWLSSGTVPGDSAAERALATRALLDLRLLVQPDGAVVAALHPGWDYAWPRDSSFVAVALASTGHSAEAVSILRFLQRMQNPDGTWAARYYPDGSGPVQDGRPAELDAVGWVPWAVWSWAMTQQLAPRPTQARTGASSQARTGVSSQARAELGQLWPMVAKAANAAMDSITSDGLPRAAMDYWEDKPIEQTLGTAAPLLAGLRSAAALAAILAPTSVSGSSASGSAVSGSAASGSAVAVDGARWAAAASRLAAAISSTFGRDGYQRTPSPDSGADAAVTFLGPPFAEPDASVVLAARAAQRALTEPNGGLRPGTAWRGAAGVAWTPETAMFALFDAGTGQQAAAQQLVSWLAAHRTSLGELPEQVAPGGKPASVAPLAWTDALVLLTLQAQATDLPVLGS
jgi:glucoamylase